MQSCLVMGEDLDIGTYLKTNVVAMNLLMLDETQTQDKQNANKIESLVMGFRLPLKGMKLVINKS